MVIVRQYFVKELLVCCLALLFKRKKVRWAWAATNTAAQERIDSLPVGRIGEAPPSTGSIQQLGDDDRPEDDLQRRITHAVGAQDSQCIESLRAVGVNTTNMIGCRQTIGDDDAENLERRDSDYSRQ